MSWFDLSNGIMPGEPNEVGAFTAGAIRPRRGTAGSGQAGPGPSAASVPQPGPGANAPGGWVGAVRHTIPALYADLYGQPSGGGWFANTLSKLGQQARDGATTGGRTGTVGTGAGGKFSGLMSPEAPGGATVGEMASSVKQPLSKIAADYQGRPSGEAWSIPGQPGSAGGDTPAPNMPKIGGTSAGMPPGAGGYRAMPGQTVGSMMPPGWGGTQPVPVPGGRPATPISGYAPAPAAGGYRPSPAGPGMSPGQPTVGSLFRPMPTGPAMGTQPVQNGAQGGFRRVQAPDGRIFRVPEARLQEALSMGGQVVG